MILISGAGGKTGKSLIKVLAKVEEICALVRRDEYVPLAKSWGAEKVIVGDLRDEAAIHSAMLDVRAVYHICPNMSPDEVTISQFVIHAARENGVEHFAFHSVLHPQTEKMNHHWQKLRVEEMIFESGLPFTILQPAPYMQNILAGWKSIMENGALRIPYSVHTLFSFIDLEDLAEAARVVLTERNHTNATYELAGTLPMSHVEVAEIFSRVLHRDVRAEKQEISDWKLHASRIHEYALENLVKMFEYYNRWGLVGNPNVLKWILDREPTSFESFVQRVLQERNEIY